MDSFERNLEQAQRDLGIHPSDFIPVTYKTDSDWLKSFFINVFPTALLIGAILYMSRKASGGKGVSGVMPQGLLSGVMPQGLLSGVIPQGLLSGVIPQGLLSGVPQGG